MQPTTKDEMIERLKKDLKEEHERKKLWRKYFFERLQLSRIECIQRRNANICDGHFIRKVYKYNPELFHAIMREEKEWRKEMRAKMRDEVKIWEEGTIEKLINSRSNRIFPIIKLKQKG